MTASQDAVGTARGRRIVQLADPIDDTDAANKRYVDGNGGSQPDGSEIEYVIPFAYNTPGILDGIEIYVPVAYTRLMAGSQISVPTTPFDGTTPNAYVYVDGFDVNTALCQTTLDTTDTETSAGMLRTTGSPFTDWDFFSGASLILKIDDGSGGDPNDPTPMTQGAAEVRLIVMTKGDVP